jgi:hypothetical protein
MTAVAAVWTATGFEFIMPKTQRAVAAVASLNIYLNSVYKHIYRI